RRRCRRSADRGPPRQRRVSHHRRRAARRAARGAAARRPARPGARGAGEMIRILLAEDPDMVRGALAALLGLEPDMEVVAQVDRGDRVVAAALAAAPDVALLDIEMPGIDGIDAAAALRAALPRCTVLILTTFGRPGYLARAMRAGVSGF